MAAINDILRIKQFFKQDDNEALMVSFWKVVIVPSGNPPESLVARAYHGKYGDIVVPSSLADTATVEKTVVDNLTDGFAFGEYENPIAGAAGGDPAPSFVAMSIRQNVGSRITRSGFKRMPFISENASNGNSVTWSPAFQAIVESWWSADNALVNPIDAQPLLTITPVVVGRTESPPDSGIYILDLDKINAVTSAVVQRPTSQNSRKA